ncbi:MAG: DUF3604 domain-containing protein, partial [Clostridia bacterium]|nr:DUF3604 domain-containing protein [Clostridia bacterium]
MNIYFGDIHNHCDISYGFGSLENALKAAREHLDFCAVTGHAMWPDIYESNDETAFIVKFHKEGFRRLRDGWDSARERIAAFNKDGEFITFQSYEMHSSALGDHHILSTDDRLEIIDAGTPGEIIAKLQNEAIAIPHHTAYTPGYRGIDWDKFDSRISPVVEVYSKHGCGVSDESADPYLHTMGPRDGRNTAYSGLAKGKIFGFTASSDHHAGYPGSYGDGLAAVMADNLSRAAIWDAIRNRRTYAVTGDRIKCSFSVNGYPMGSQIDAGGEFRIAFSAQAADFIEKAVVYRNLEAVKSIRREDFKRPHRGRGIYKVRIENGWGRKTGAFKWHGEARVRGGVLLDVEKHFRGQSVLAPREGEYYPGEVNDLGNKVISMDDKEVAWECSTFRNPTARHPGTCSMVLEIEGSPDTRMELDFNGKKTEVSIGGLLEGGISGHLKEYNSEAYLIHKAVPESMYRIDMEFIEKAQAGDFFHAELHQTNGQSAWIS